MSFSCVVLDMIQKFLKYLRNIFRTVMKERQLFIGESCHTSVIKYVK